MRKFRPLPLLLWIVCAALTAGPALAQTQTTVTITNPVLPLLGGPDTDGRLVPTSQTFQEGGMHVESFWIKNNGTTFVPGHFHLHVNNQYETTHGFATVPGLGPTDHLGFYIEREDHGPFDLNQVDYRLKLSTLATDLMISPTLNPALPVPPQLTHFPVVKLANFQTLATPGFTNVHHLWVVWELPEDANNYQAELDNFVFTFPAGSCNPSVAPGVIQQHDGLANPVTEGWTRDGTATNVSEGAVAGDLGHDAWTIDDNDTVAGSTLQYVRNLTPDEMCWARTSGFALRGVIRAADVPDAADASVAMSFFDSQRLFELRLGMSASGHPIASISGQSVSLNGLDAGYHTYELVYDPPTRTVDLRVDGNEVLSNRPGVGLSVAAPRIAFGSNDVAGTGQGNFAQVQFELPQKCSNRIDDDGDGLIDYPADPGCSGPDDTTETAACGDGIDNDGDGLVDFPADPGCASANDDSEQSPSLVCDDGADNDGDGLVDFPADPGCASPSDPTETSACSDGLDDDGDGLIDFPADPGCASAADDSEKAAGLVCDDGVDNDGDGLVDFPADAGCQSPSDGSEVSPTLVCDDGIDNDGDGLIDYPADPGCASENDSSETTACSDGVDDDGDGLVDFPADPGCASALDDSEKSPALACDDGIDNDGDGAIDFPLDAGCADPSDGNEISACGDGVDNDGDGLVDFPADPGCADASDDSERAVALACDDGIDNDGDGLVDFPADPGCTSASDPSETAACSDGVDNDGDGQTDFPNDAGCDSANDDSEKSPALVCDNGIDDDGDGKADFPTDPGCASPADATETSACDDGVDNDGDGLVDFPADPGCSSAADDSERAAELACDDGIDNDGDGFTDFPADANCASPSGETEASACNNGVDDDGDGLVDLADPGCSDANDDSEKSPFLICDDGIDQDGDGKIDWPADVGCRDLLAGIENPKCQDGLDNDGDGKIDFDGGASLNGGVPLGPPDPGCESKPYKNSESAASHCGLGAELVFAMPLLAFWKRRRARR